VATDPDLPCFHKLNPRFARVNSPDRRRDLVRSGRTDRRAIEHLYDIGQEGIKLPRRGTMRETRELVRDLSSRWEVMAKARTAGWNKATRRAFIQWSHYVGAYLRCSHPISACHTVARDNKGWLYDPSRNMC
jgi:hypothetical protein